MVAPEIELTEGAFKILSGPMKKLSALLAVLAGILALSSVGAKAQTVDIAITNDGTTTKIYFVATGAASPNKITYTGSLGDGISFYDLFAEGGIGLPTFTGSYNSGEYYNGPTANPTGNLIAEGGDAYFNAAYANSFSDQADEQNLNLFVATPVQGQKNDIGGPLYVGSDSGVEDFRANSITLSGELVWTLSDAVDYQLVDYFLPYVGDHGNIITGFNGSDAGGSGSVSEAGGAAQRDYSPLNTVPGNVIGSWQVVSYADLPSPEVADAPEPRSWAFAGVVLLAVVGLRRRLLGGGASVA